MQRRERGEDNFCLADTEILVDHNTVTLDGSFIAVWPSPESRSAGSKQFVLMAGKIRQLCNTHSSRLGVSLPRTRSPPLHSPNAADSRSP
jgi:hypothetical protein